MCNISSVGWLDFLYIKIFSLQEYSHMTTSTWREKDGTLAALLSASSLQIHRNQTTTAKNTFRDFKCKYFVAGIRQHCVQWRQEHALNLKSTFATQCMTFERHSAGKLFFCGWNAFSHSSASIWHHGYILAKKSSFRCTTLTQIEKKKKMYFSEVDSRDKPPPTAPTTPPHHSLWNDGILYSAFPFCSPFQVWPLGSSSNTGEEKTLIKRKGSKDAWGRKKAFYLALEKGGFSQSSQPTRTKCKSQDED